MKIIILYFLIFYLFSAMESDSCGVTLDLKLFCEDPTYIYFQIGPYIFHPVDVLNERGFTSICDDDVPYWITEDRYIPELNINRCSKQATIWILWYVYFILNNLLLCFLFFAMWPIFMLAGLQLLFHFCKFCEACSKSSKMSRVARFLNICLSGFIVLVVVFFYLLYLLYFHSLC